MIEINNKVDYIFYTNNTPNTYKIKLMFHELEKKHAITFESRIIDITKKENYSDEFIKINPNKKVPAIIDQTGEKPFIVFESVSILIYLAQKYSSIFLPDFKTNPLENSEVITWAIWQAANLGPAFGQYFHFSFFSPTVQEYSLHRFNNEAQRILRLLDDRLSVSPYIGGKEYSIADIASAGWLLYLNFAPIYNANKDRFPNLFKWLDLINQRDAVKQVNEAIKERFGAFNTSPLRSLFTNDPDLINAKAPIGIENVVLKYD
ncbi:hypothetical protein RB653_002119 [Dictyostelium firmibasis]|uniref:Glutathione S-transferase n=1 Tax=Dictyostelium firmibasis TaxID=79012 RepID=A0AAN7TWI8_9MYCE